LLVLWLKRGIARIIHMSSEIVTYFEALRLLKEWSTVLLALQAGILIALIFIGAHLDIKTIEKVRKLLIYTMAFSVLSILVGLNVIGTIPWSTQALSGLVAKYHDIYQFPNYIGIPIWVLAFGQHIFFICAMVLLMAFAYTFLKGRR
jgi:hypothetical protein